VEHIFPPSQGGVDGEFNLALACRSCNLRKGIRVSGLDPESNTEVRYSPKIILYFVHYSAIKNLEFWNVHLAQFNGIIL